jgi:hypothetical protein
MTMTIATSSRWGTVSGSAVRRAIGGELLYHRVGLGVNGSGMSDDTSPLTDELQQLLGQFERLLKSTLGDNTWAAVAVAAAAGFVAGVLLARRKS